jgi:hypothetical protein
LLFLFLRSQNKRPALQRQNWGVFPFSGPASSLCLVGRGVQAYIESVNERGGINGRKINYLAMDDAYSPPKAVEQIRRLVESDQVAFIFSQLGTPGNTAVAKYLLSKKVPSIAVVSGSAKFTNVNEFPLTTTGLVSYEDGRDRLEAHADRQLSLGLDPLDAEASGP